MATNTAISEITDPLSLELEADREYDFSNGVRGSQQQKYFLKPAGEFYVGIKEPNRTATTLTAEILRDTFNTSSDTHFLSAFNAPLISAKPPTRSRMWPSFLDRYETTWGAA